MKQVKRKVKNSYRKTWGTDPRIGAMLDHHTAVQSHFTADSINTEHLFSLAFPEILSHSIILGKKPDREFIT